MSMPVETIMDQSSVASCQWPADDAQTLAESGFHWRERDGVKVLVCKPLDDAGFVNGFSTRLGGVSDVKSEPPALAGGLLGGGDLNLAGFDEDSTENIYENRRRFLSVFDGEFRLATAWQIHGDGVKNVRNNEDIANSEEKFDALVSDIPGVLLGVKTADCVPVLIGDTRAKAFAAVHAGWRGTVQSIVVRAIETLQKEYDGEPKNMIAAIGPAALCGNYEIGQDVIDAFAEAFSTSEKYFAPTCEGHALIDLHLANKDQLISCGVPLSNIYTAPFCTMERTDLFFSYRVEKKLHGRTGRLMSVIGRRN